MPLASKVCIWLVLYGHDTTRCLIIQNTSSADPVCHFDPGNLCLLKSGKPDVFAALPAQPSGEDIEEFVEYQKNFFLALTVPIIQSRN